jgi:hypothetical protein
MKLKPNKLQTFYIYKCPHCKIETWFDDEDVKYKPGFTCACGKRNEIEKITRCVPQYANKLSVCEQEATPRTKADRKGLGDTARKFVNTLVNLGYKRGEAKRIVDSTISSYVDDESFLQLLLTTKK